MIRIVYLALAFIFFMPEYASADPVGTYDVVGENPGSGSRYTGSVVIERYGQVYNVFWNVAGEEFKGTGIGAAMVNGELMFSSATTNDTALSISYASGNAIGVALFIKQRNGQWNGIWNFGESDSIGTELWFPR